MSDSGKDGGGAARSAYRDTVFLPKTDFPMKAGLPAAEPRWLERWEETRLYERLRQDAKAREQFVLHDGPPYANGHAHIGHALNHILKDFVVRSRQMMGFDAPYVPGWDCHGLPIEWAVEQQIRKSGKTKEEVPIAELRAMCRDFARQWIDIQREEFKRLGCVGEWDKPYLTMNFDAEATIVRELHKFLMNGALYRGSKPVMWSVVEKTALAEAEIEYHEHASTTVFVKFPFSGYRQRLGVRAAGEGYPLEPVDRAEPPSQWPSYDGASVVIWTTTPWTIPGNRAIAFSPSIEYGVYEVDAVDEGSMAHPNEKLILADALAENIKSTGKISTWRRLYGCDPAHLVCQHPFHGAGYDFPVPLLPGEHVTAETGTGFVHTAPGHGEEDFELVRDHNAHLKHDDPARIEIPFTVNEDGTYADDLPLFAGKRVLTPDGKEGDANGAVIRELVQRGMLLAKGKLRHQYPHSWRSKAPVIFRNTPQWFVALDVPFEHLGGKTLRQVALDEIDRVAFYPAQGRNRIRSMVETRPDWVLSRQRAWGVPIAVFVNKKTGEVLRDPQVNERIGTAMDEDGADAWFSSPPERFLGNAYAPADYEQVTDILDVWFDSGSTHVFTLESGRWGLKWPADLYLEGSDQHRGWFQSSLLESCGTRGRAPYDAVLTHGFVLDEKGEAKMSKSKGNVLSPQDVAKQNGAEIMRLWVASIDFTGDVRFGPSIVKANVDAYRKLRNTFRFLLGALAGFAPEEKLSFAEMRAGEAEGLDLELFMLDRLAALDTLVRAKYAEYDFTEVYQELFNFCTGDLSAFYFDIRKDVLYCDPKDSLRRRACRTVLDEIFSLLTAWLAPILTFTAEEVWQTRFPSADGSVHLRTFPEVPAEWRNETVAKNWQLRRRLRRVVTGALEIERRDKVIGSSLDAAPLVYVEDEEIRAALSGVKLAEICITSDLEIAPLDAKAPDDAYRLSEVPGVAVVFRRAEGEKCERCWMILPEVGTVTEHPTLCRRCASAVGSHVEAA